MLSSQQEHYGLERCFACGVSYVRRDGHTCIPVIMKGNPYYNKRVNPYVEVIKLDKGFNETIIQKEDSDAKL